MKRIKKIKKKLIEIISLFGKSLESFIVKYLATIGLAIGSYWVIVDVFWTILNIVEYYLDEKLFAKNNWIWILILVIPLVITITYVVIVLKANNLKKKVDECEELNLQSNEMIQFHRSIIEKSFNMINEQIFINEIDTSFQNGDYLKTIKIGKYGSRLFLMFAKYDLRIKYGEYIIRAAEKSNDSINKAVGKIDCVGWSYVKKGNIDEAIKNITEGLKEIENDNTKEANVMKCKGCRHLLAIEIKGENKANALKKREEFSRLISNLNGRDKKIMQASLSIIDGDIQSTFFQDYEKAKRLYKEGNSIYKKCSDFDRAVKTYHKLGEINLKMTQYPKALKYFLIGFWSSDQLSRIDEKQKNCQSIVELLKNHSEKVKIEELKDIKDCRKDLLEGGVDLERKLDFYENELDLMNKLINHSNATSS